jgi:hypothetical protein
MIKLMWCTVKEREREREREEQNADLYNDHFNNKYPELIKIAGN